MNSNHTPGPWRVTNSKTAVVAGNVRISQSSGPCAASVSVQESIGDTREANAKLVASAPDLLEACVTLLEQLGRSQIAVFPEDCDLPDPVQMMEQAVAKAGVSVDYS